MIGQLKSLLSKSRRVRVMTGAGISAESGIPTFRGPGGLWKQFKPEDLATPEAFQRDPKLVWEWYDWRRQLIAKAEPNPGHLALVELEKRIKDFWLITQNVDGLHQRAGSRRVLTLHGDLWRSRCLDCGKYYDEKKTPLDQIPPRCPCGGLKRPDVVWFGEDLPAGTFGKALDAARDAELFLVVGTSGTVEPAASLARVAKESGAALAEINPEPSALSAHADVFIQAKAGEVLPKLLRLLPALALCFFCAACSIPQSCMSYESPPGNLSYETAVLKRNMPIVAWQKALRDTLASKLSSNSLPQPGQLRYRMGRPSRIISPNNTALLETEVALISPFDGSTIRAWILEPETPPASPHPGVVLLLHGHRSSAEDALRPGSNLRGIGFNLVRAGFVVVAPEIRSFGGVRFLELGHKIYLRKEAPGEFLKEAVADARSSLVFIQARFPRRASLSVIGYSLGGYIALHVAALDPTIDNTVISGAFLPYSCLNTDYHHECQHFTGLSGEAEMSDIAGLIAPRRLMVHFGGKDPRYTPAATETVRKAEMVFVGLGVKDNMQFAASPKLGHQLDPGAVVRFLMKRPPPLSADR